mgnify:CR=1 FL=1
MVMTMADDLVTERHRVGWAMAAKFSLKTVPISKWVEIQYKNFHDFFAFYKVNFVHLKGLILVYEARYLYLPVPTSTKVSFDSSERKDVHEPVHF